MYLRNVSLFFVVHLGSWLIGGMAISAWLLLQASAWSQTLAFEGAEGFGAYATGARTNLNSASVYRVTNLNDSGAGSFRDAVSASNRFVVFDVGGVINISSPIVVKSNTTIAGQTAPGGIAVFGDKVSYSAASNTISRHMAYRLGRAAGREDASGASNGANMMFDHMSITWGVDETLSFNSDGKGTPLDRITVQNSIIGQGLDVVGHSAGGLMTFPEGGRFSIIKSLFTDSVTRNPKVRGENEFINNVVYGWETAAYIMGDTSNMDSHANAIGNYFIEGPVNGGDPFRSGDPRFEIYGEGNMHDGNRDGVLNGSLITNYPGATVVSNPHHFGTPNAPAMTAEEAVAYVLKHAGPSIVRDVVDTRIMEEVASYGTLGGVIVRETDLFTNYGSNPDYLNPRARLVDADGDGMADNWEAAHGLSSTNANDWRNLSAAGYAQIEEYVNELGATGQTVVSSGGGWSNSATWGGNTPRLADELVVVGDLSQSSGHAFARSMAQSGNLNFTGGTLDVFDTAEFSNGTATFNGASATFGRLLVGATGQSAMVTVTGGGTLQGGTITDAGGNGSLAFDGGTFRATGTPIITLNTSLGTGGGTLDTNGFNAIHSGQITGTGGLTKIGGGSLVLSGDNSFSGGMNVTGDVKLAHNRGAGSGNIMINGNGGRLVLADGVTINNDMFTSYSFEVLDVADANATATYAGNITANGSSQIRLQTTGGGSRLDLTGDVDAGSSFFIQKTGNVDLRDDGSLTAGIAIVGRDGGVTRLSIRDNAVANVGSLSMGGGRGLTAGRITVRDNSSLTVGGNVDLLSTNSGTSSSEFWLVGGTATVNGITKSSTGSTQTSEIRFEGGELRYGGSSANANFLPNLTGLTANVRAGGAIINSNGQDITIAHSLEHDASGPATDGGLTKRGNGTLTLTGNNTYNGTTTVEQGTLRVAHGGSIITSLTSIEAGGTLGGDGTVGWIDLQTGGQIAPGNSIGTLTLSSEVFSPLDWYGEQNGSNHAQMLFELSMIDNASDRITGLDFLTNAGGDVFLFDFQNSGLADQTYTLIEFDALGAINGQDPFAADDFRYVNLASGLDGSFSMTSNALQFTTFESVAIPEPGSIGLLALICLSGCRRRRR